MTGYDLYKSIMSNRYIIDNKFGDGTEANYCTITLNRNYVIVTGEYNGGLHAEDRCPGDNGAGYLSGTSWSYSVRLADLPVEERLEVIRHPKMVVDIEAWESDFPLVMPNLGSETDDYYLD